MDSNKIISRFGLFGVFVVCFLSGTVLPGISEVTMAGLAVAGVYRTVPLLVIGSVGNLLGSVTTYAIGWMFGYERLMEYFEISEESIGEWIWIVQDYGSLAGLLAWAPIIGNIVVAALGICKTSIVATCLTMFIGKIVRYAVIVLPLVKARKAYKKRNEKE